MSGAIGFVLPLGSECSGSVGRSSSFTLRAGRPVSLRNAARSCGLQVGDRGGYGPEAATSNEKLQADCDKLPPPGDVIAMHVMAVCSKYSLLIPVRAWKDQEVSRALCSSWIGVSGPPWSIQMDEGGGWTNESWTELRPDRRIKL